MAIWNAIEFIRAGRGSAIREIGMRSTDSRADELLSQPGVGDGWFEMKLPRNLVSG